MSLPSPASIALSGRIREVGAEAAAGQYSPGSRHPEGAWSTPCRCGCFLYEALCLPCAAGDVAEHLSPPSQHGTCCCLPFRRYCCCTCLICLIPYVGPAVATCRLWDQRQKLMERDKIPADGVGFWWMLCCMPCFLAQERRHVADREQAHHHAGGGRSTLDSEASEDFAFGAGAGSFAPPPGIAPPSPGKGPPPGRAARGATKQPPPGLALRGAPKDQGALTGGTYYVDVE